MEKMAKVTPERPASSKHGVKSKSRSIEIGPHPSGSKQKAIAPYWAEDLRNSVVGWRKRLPSFRGFNGGP